MGPRGWIVKAALNVDIYKVVKIHSKNMKIYRIHEYMRYSYDSQLTSKYSDPLQLHGTSKIRIHTHAVRGGSGE